MDPTINFRRSGYGRPQLTKNGPGTVLGMQCCMQPSCQGNPCQGAQGEMNPPPRNNMNQNASMNMQPPTGGNMGQNPPMNMRRPDGDMEQRPSMDMQPPARGNMGQNPPMNMRRPDGGNMDRQSNMSSNMPSTAQPDRRMPSGQMEPVLPESPSSSVPTMNFPSSSANSQASVRPAAQMGTMPPSNMSDCPNIPIGCIEEYPVGMGYVPMQQWRQTYNLEQGFSRGTIFPELDLPFIMGRCQ